MTAVICHLESASYACPLLGIAFLRRWLANPRLPLILLWIGLAFLIVALTVAICTSWGQSRPLRKCAGLSLLAHLLLAGYATTIEIVYATGSGGSGAVGVSLVAEDGLDSGEFVPWEVADDATTEAEVDPTAQPPDAAQDDEAESHDIAVNEPPPVRPPPLLEVADKQPDAADTAATPPEAASSTNEAAALPEPALVADLADWLSNVVAAARTALQSVPAADHATRTPPSDQAPLVEVASAPISSQAVPEIYSARVSSKRAQIAQGNGGSPDAEAAVQGALQWLAAHQSSDGRWDPDQFGAGRETNTLGHNRQGAGANADTGVTGLAILAFVGSGRTHQQGDHTETVRRGLEFLISSQRSDGNLAGNAEMYAFMYCHGMATLALSEAYAMSGDKRLEPPLTKAIRYTLASQHPGTGGWRYRPGELGDTSQLGWQLMALRSAELAGIEMPSSTRVRINKFLRSVSSGQYGGIASYRPGERPSRSMTAEALVCRQFLGLSRDDPACNEAGDYVLGELPSDQRINLYYWYYGTLGMFQLQGPHWEQWNAALQSTLIKRQRGDGDMAGSWDPDCLWGGYGGRVYSTAMSALCLEVYYRYLPIYRVANR